jgi:methionine sulfoxide reductase heme-binding subunit
MTAVDLSSYAGLAAMILLTVNVLLGLMLSTRYSPPARWWPYGRRRIFDVHNWTAYIALGVVFLHPILLLISHSAGFHVIDVVWPINSPGQSLYNCLGALALYLTVFVVITSYLRKRLGFQVWKTLHYLSYAAASVLFIHGIIIDPNLKKQPPDLLDGEKVLIEICCLLVVAGSVWRVRYALQKEKRLSTVETVW